MATERTARRLAAILCADVVGYSRLMEAGESDTLARFKRHRDELLNPMIAHHGGRLVGTAGDSLLVEFASVVDAVQAAVAIQIGMAERNQGVPDDRRIDLRVGVNLGDIIVDGDDIHGDGVNVAARLERMCEPGGICVSGTVHEHIAGKLDHEFVDLGERVVKNITRPVRVYRIDLGRTTSRAMAIGPVNPPLPDKPSIAVLPFANMTSAPDQEYFSDGISEDITTELSRFKDLFVIARNSSFTFKGQVADIKEIGRRLGARYVVEGSVRRAGNRVRVTAQLIDAIEDQHVWAERYDRALDDIFDVQDEVTRAIVAAIEPQLANAERQRARRRAPENLGSWELYQRALWHHFQYKAGDAAMACELLVQATLLDPTFSSAHAALAYQLYYGVILGFSNDRQGDLARALEAARTAVLLDDGNAFAHVVLGRVHTARGEHDAAIASCDTAIALNPNFATAHFGRAHSLWHCGRANEALPSFDEAMRLSPRDPLMWAILASKAIALILLGRCEEALDWARKAQRQPNAALYAFVPEVGALGLLGRIEEGRAAVERLRAFKPDLTIAFLTESLPITDAAYRETFTRGLIAAGVPRDGM